MPTDEHLRTLRHMLGINDPWMRFPTPTRDYYCANPGDPQLQAMAAAGLVELYSTRDRYEWFRTTAAGRAAAMASHKTIRNSKSARVYRAFLNVRDCFSELSFIEFLTDAEFAQTRRLA